MAHLVGVTGLPSRRLEGGIVRVHPGSIPGRSTPESPPVPHQDNRCRWKSVFDSPVSGLALCPGGFGPGATPATTTSTPPGLYEDHYV